MAAAKKSVSVVMTNPDEKKKVVRYHGAEDNGVMDSAYIDKRGLAKIGNPAKIKVTIEPA